MNCIFCGKEIEGRRYHLDCFEEEIEKVFGKEALNVLYLVSSGHEVVHLEEECSFCAAPKKREEIFELIKKGVPEGRRHITRFIIMSNLRRLGYPKEKIKQLIFEFNSNCRPPEKESVVEYHVNYTFKRWERGY